jgi:hypothetical protein
MAGVRTEHPEYTAMVETWKRCRDIAKGQRAVHAAGKKYLPPNGAESDEDFKARLARSDFFNATWRTIAGLVGMAFRKDPAISVPPRIEPYLDDIDLTGRSLSSFAKDACEDVLEIGRIGLLVDHPPRPSDVTPISEQVAERLGLRPVLKAYDGPAIINWRFERIGNATVLTRVVLKEMDFAEKNEFEQDEIVRYRVLDLLNGIYRQRVFEVIEGKDVQIGGDVFPLMNGLPMSYIPFKFVGANGKGEGVEEPPLIDLVDANVAHYQVNSDIRVAMHFGVPTFCISGYTPEINEQITVGSRAAIILPDPAAKAYFAEPEGAMLSDMRAALKEIEQRMAILGARMIADETRQAETLGATQIKRAGENSVMAALVVGLSDAITWALEVMAEWAGAGGEVIYEINREFNPFGLSAQDFVAYMSAVQQGLMSEQEFYTLMQRGDVIDPTKPFEDHQEEIGQAGPVAPDVPNEQQGMAA